MRVVHFIKPNDDFSVKELAGDFSLVRVSGSGEGIALVFEDLKHLEQLGAKINSYLHYKYQYMKKETDAITTKEEPINIIEGPDPADQDCRVHHGSEGEYLSREDERDIFGFNFAL